LWGAPRIAQSGFEIAESTVSKYMIRRRGPPSQTQPTPAAEAPDDASVIAITSGRVARSPGTANATRPTTAAPYSRPASGDGKLIRARRTTAASGAKARGVRFGRPLKLAAHQRQESIQRLAEGAVQADLARSYGVSQATISRLAAPNPFEASAAGG